MCVHLHTVPSQPNRTLEQCGPVQSAVILVHQPIDRQLTGDRHRKWAILQIGLVEVRGPHEGAGLLATIVDVAFAGFPN